MLNHYVPRFYLKGFCCEDSGDQVWVFDKAAQKFFRAGVGKVGAVHGFYDDDVEEELNRNVEAPGNAVIQAIRDREAITPQQKARLAYYIGVLMMRVPERRRKALDILPGVLDETVTEVCREIEAFRGDDEVEDQLIDRRLAEMESCRRKFKDQPPQSVIESIRMPWPTKNMVNALYSMRWRFGVTSGPSFLITSDNPVFFFTAYGVGRPESELTFSISSEVVLFGDRQSRQRRSPEYVELSARYAREVNRRVASKATRFIFHRDTPDWIPVIANKQTPYLSRILWGGA